MERELIINGKYRHFKGHIYKVLMIAKSYDDLSDLVVYQDVLDKDKVWVRRKV